jgi:hypothetical protein
MKKIFYLFNIAITMLVLNNFAKAQPAYAEKEFEKKKNITQIYDLSASDRVSLSNKFGNIKVNTWTESKIKVEVEIEVNAQTEDKATKILDGITINHSKEGGVVSFKTKIDNDKTGGNRMNRSDDGNHEDCESCDEKNKNKNGSWGNLGMKINYTVFLPASTTMKLYNEFGNTTLSNYSGALDAHNKFGNFIAETLSSSENEIFVEFGNAEIKSLSKPDLTVKFGNCDLANVVGAGALKYEFCGDVNVTLDKSVGDLKIKNSYSNIELTLNDNTNATFNIKSSYGDVKNKNKNLTMKSDEDDDDDEKGCCNFTKNHKGTIGSGLAVVTISNSYGKIKFR